MIRSSGEVTVAFVTDFVKGMYEVALDTPVSQSLKLVCEGEIKPADSGYDKGARVLVKRSSGAETVAYIEAFDSVKGMYDVRHAARGLGS